MTSTTQLTLQFIIEAISGQRPEGATPIRDAVIDSRQAAPGSLFVALPGENSDGHQWVSRAFEAGALAALIDQPVSTEAAEIDLRPGAVVPGSLPEGPICLRVENALLALQKAAMAWYTAWIALPGRRTVGITGSVGKTTCKEAIAALLGQQYRSYRNAGSFNNEIGLPLSVLQIQPEHERAVLEMGFYVPGEIELLCRIAPPQIGVVTVIHPVHLERAGSIDTIIRGKAELLEHLPADGIAILNADDPRVMQMAQWNRGRLFTYGRGEGVDLRAEDIAGLGLEGIRLSLCHAGHREPVHSPLLGRHSAVTVLAAAAVGLNDGMSWEAIRVGLETPYAPPRLVPKTAPGGFLILDDTYNASPGAVIAALDLLADVRAVQRVAILGDMLELGSFEAEGHASVGQHAAGIAHHLITLGPRAEMIAAAAESAGLAPARITVCSSVEGAVARCLDLVRGAGDVVLVKGSRAVGMERVVAGLMDHRPGDWSI